MTRKQRVRATLDSLTSESKAALQRRELDAFDAELASYNDVLEAFSEEEYLLRQGTTQGIHTLINAATPEQGVLSIFLAGILAGFMVANRTGDAQGLEEQLTRR